MRYTKTVTPKHHVTTSRITCDFCGENVSIGEYSINEVTLTCRTGDHYPEGDFTVVEEIDCCVSCFASKVKPAIEALGVRFRTRESDELYKHAISEDT